MKEINKIVSKFEDRIEKNIEETKKDGKEHGFIICENSSGISTKELQGGEGIIAIGKCDSGRRIGWFHTHPKREEAFPSPTDLINTKETGMDFLCIASEGGDLKCFRTKITDKDINEYENNRDVFVESENRLYEKTDVIYPEGKYKLY